MCRLVRWTIAITGSAAMFAGSWYACQDLARLDSGTSGLIASAALVLTLAVLAWWAAREPVSPAAQVPDPATATATGNRSQAVAGNTGFVLSGEIHNSTIHVTGGHDSDEQPTAGSLRERGVYPQVAGDVPKPFPPPVANTKEAIQLGKRGAETQPPERIFVRRTPRELTGLFKNETSIQAQKLADAFYGKWLKVSGPLGDVSAWTGSCSHVTFEHKKSSDPVVVMTFRDRSYVENRLSVLRRGDRITVQGQIERIDLISVQLTSCELADS